MRGKFRLGGRAGRLVGLGGFSGSGKDGVDMAYSFR